MGNGLPASRLRFLLILRRARGIARLQLACGLREFFADFAEELRGAALRFGGHLVLHIITKACELFVEPAADIFELVHWL
jgi:hypothetical protein